DLNALAQAQLDGPIVVNAIGDVTGFSQPRSFIELIGGAIIPATERFTGALLPPTGVPGSFFAIDYSDPTSVRLKIITLESLDLSYNDTYAAEGAANSGALGELIDNDDGALPELVLTVRDLDSVFVFENAGLNGDDWAGFVAGAGSVIQIPVGPEPVDIKIGEIIDSASGPALQDIVVCNNGGASGDESITIIRNGEDGNGDSLLAANPETITIPTTVRLNAIDLADFDLDGELDIVGVGTAYSDGLLGQGVVVLNNGGGSGFQTVSPPFGINLIPLDVRAKDVATFPGDPAPNMNQPPDIVTASRDSGNASGLLQVFTNRNGGPGNQFDQNDIGVPDSFQIGLINGLDICDIDNDDDFDILSYGDSGPDSGFLTVLPNIGGADFDVPIRFDVDGRVRSMAAGRFNEGDSRDDLALIVEENGEGVLRVYQNNSEPGSELIVFNEIEPT
ncbi:MAG: hypothetical protein K8E66_02400, partial [Phycisphaerales bacterium]|nr:hypothetical protein [Phycisphaerales bacterium]